MSLALLGFAAMMAVPLVLLFYVRNRYSVVFVVLAWFYPVGEVLQLLMTVPSWIRWHMSDVGAIPNIGLLLAVTISRFRSSRQELLRYAEVGVAVAFAMAVALEVWGLLMMSANPADREFHGDWIDVSIFVLAFCVSVLLIRRMRQIQDQQALSPSLRPNET